MIAAHRLLGRALMGAPDDARLGVAVRLWGGAGAMEWAQALIADRPTAVEAAPSARDLSGLSARLERVDDVARAAIEAAVEAITTEILARLAGIAANRLRRPARPLVAAAGGPDQVREVRAAMDDLAQHAQLGVVPVPVLAQLGLAELDVFDRAMVEALEPQILRILEQAHADTVAALREAFPGLSDEAVEAIVAAQEQDRLAAVVLLVAGLRAEIERRVVPGPTGADIDPDDIVDVPGRVVPPSLVTAAAARAGGLVLDQATTGGLVELPGPTGSGVSLGPTVLGRVPVGVSSVTEWRWGGAAFPFEPHRRLDGVTWRSEEERRSVCANRGAFPRGPVLFPGDHRGCTCYWRAKLIVGPNVGQT
jgi:hypothetical protein